jgi:hypothetical protein
MLVFKSTGWIECEADRRTEGCRTRPGNCHNNGTVAVEWIVTRDVYVRKEGDLSIMKIVIAYEGAGPGDAAVDDLARAGLPPRRAGHRL